MALKHVGRTKTNRQKLVVAYRTLPNDPYNALVIPTASLPADEHDTLMKAVESAAGQEANEFYEVMQRTYLPDGRNMLAGFHTRGQMRKMATDAIEMTPDTRSAVPLNELNEIIAQQKGVAVEDLALTNEQAAKAYTAPAEEQTAEEPVAVETQSDVITDEQLAAQYRSQADALFKEAKKLREQAEELAPTKKRTTKKKEESVEG